MNEAHIKAILRAYVPREVRNWLRSPAQSAQWLWRSGLGRMGRNRTWTLAEGSRIICHPIAYRSVRTQAEDPEQAAELASFRRHCRPGMFLFDVGANFGLFSLICVRMGGRALAIEPSAMAAGIIRKQMQLNRTGVAMELIEAAAGEHEGFIELLSTGVISDGFYKYEPWRDARELKRVAMTSLDRLCARAGEPSHLKIDVEGYEAAVLRGARNLLARKSATIFLELHNEMAKAAGEDPRFCLEELSRHGYRIYSIHGENLDWDKALNRPICRILAAP